jgi:large-conductance mechanosensitive channel
VILSKLLGAIVWLDDPTPTPIPAFEGDVNLVTPGVVGFIVTFLIAVATVFLVLDMVRRVRRVRYRAEVQQQLDDENGTSESSSANPTPGD